MKFWISEHRATITGFVVLAIMMILQFCGIVPSPVVISTLLMTAGFFIVETLISRSALNEDQKPDK